MNRYENLIRIYDFVKPAIDIGILTFIFYKLYKLIARTNALHLIRSAVMVTLAYAVVNLLHLDTLIWVFNVLAPGLFMAFAIVFQPELRKIFLKLGQTDWFTFEARAKHSYLDSVLIAAERLSKQKRGMLIVFKQNTELEDILKTGMPLNADLTANLLETIFAFNTPMHDGAAVVKGNKILAAGCFLPLSDQVDIKKTFGSRHRAALGISEQTDCVALVVSEETGAFSLAYDSKLHYDLSYKQLENILVKYLGITREDQVIEDTLDEHKTIV